MVQNVLKTPAIRLAARGAELRARATPVTDPAKVAEVIEGFRAKYGARSVEQYNPKRDVAVEIQLATSEGSSRPRDAARFVAE